MFASDEGIVIAVISTALLMVILVGVIILAVVLYQNRLRRHLQEVDRLESTYQQELLKAQLEVKEQTLHTISQEIHDNVGQILSLAKLNLNTIDGRLPEDVVKKVKATSELVSKAIHDLRDLSKTLNTEYINHQEFSEVLSQELKYLESSRTVAIQYIVEGEELPIDPKKAIILFRIVQEVLNNIVKHAQAQKILLILEYKPEQVNLFIQDNGQGFDLLTLEDIGTGIYNMRHRASLIGANFIINSCIDRGTQVTLSLPLKE